MHNTKFTITGIVQGVGFRPFIYNACNEAGLVGYVQNIGTGVEVVVNDKEPLEQILRSLPPLARIDDVRVQKVGGTYHKFEIKESLGEGHAEIPADLFLCHECLCELRDPKNRRFGYFFITCTNCGPRFTMGKKSPYDRKTTSMQSFRMCDTCRMEYQDPKNRRYHAQTIACHECGPRLKLAHNGVIVSDDSATAIQRTAERIQKGDVVAIKGVGGFHLACNTQPETVQKLKTITGRANKPFSLLSRDISMVRSFVQLTQEEQKLLESPARPIVILKKTKELAGVTELDSVGVLLPYTALHYLLFDHIDEPIVMTSANLSGEPIRTQYVDDMVEYVLDHNRPIENAADDSLMKVIANTPVYIRRSRGFVPQSLVLKSSSSKTILALGAEMNASFCLWKDGRAILSQYLGNTANIKTFEHYKQMLKKFLDLTDMRPGGVLADLHPTYNTSLYAEELADMWNVPLMRIQHHAAHAFGVAVEHELEDFSAIVCDGLGYGVDGHLWGGEVFYNDLRVGHLENQAQLGGDSATRYPAKMAFSILRKFMNKNDAAQYMSDHFTSMELEVLEKQYMEKFNAPLTSSCGRVLDAAAALLGFCDEKTYDGRPAMLLEANSASLHEAYDIEPIIQEDDSTNVRTFVLMTTPLFEFLIKNIYKDKRRLAATVQLYIAQGLHKIAHQYSDEVVFSGGCAYDRIMTEHLLSEGVHINKNIPAGDGGIAFGQVAYYLAAEKKVYTDLVSNMTRQS